MDTEPVVDIPDEAALETPAPPPPPPPTANTAKTWAIASVVAVVALVAGVLGVKVLDKSEPAQAVNTQDAGTFAQRPTAGKITSISRSTFKVAATDFNGASSTVNVTTSKSTTYTEAVSGAVSDLKVGDTVVASGTTTDGVLTATRLSQAELRASRATSNRGANDAPNGAPPPGAITNGNGPGFNQQSGPSANGNVTVGAVKSITDGVLTLSAPDGTTTTVKTTADTAVIVNKTIAFKDLKVGDSVRVAGTATNGTVAATDVTKGDQGAGFIFGGNRP